MSNDDGADGIHECIRDEYEHKLNINVYYTVLFLLQAQSMVILSE